MLLSDGLERRDLVHQGFAVLLLLAELLHLVLDVRAQLLEGGSRQESSGGGADDEADDERYGFGGHVVLSG